MAGLHLPLGDIIRHCAAQSVAYPEHRRGYGSV